MASNRKQPAVKDDGPPAGDALSPEAETNSADVDDSSHAAPDSDPQVVSGLAPNRSKRRVADKLKSRFLKTNPAAFAQADDVPDEEDIDTEKKLQKKMREAAEAEQAERERLAQGMQQLSAVIQHCWGDNVDPKRSKLSSQYLMQLSHMETAEPTGDGGFKMKLKNGNSVVHGYLQGPPGPEGEPGQPVEYIKGTRWGFTATDAHAIIALAALHGWQSVEVHGNEDQKKELYLAAMAQGLDVTGYEPDAKTLQQGQIARAQFEQENPEFAPMTEDTPVATKSAPQQDAPVDGAFDDPVPPETGGENTETAAQSVAEKPAPPKEPVAEPPAKTGQSATFEGAAADTRSGDKPTRQDSQQGGNKHRKGHKHGGRGPRH